MSGEVGVLGVNGSPRRYGSAYKLLRVALRAAEAEGAAAKLVHLYDYEIRPCLGCVSDVQEACRYPCVIEDDMRCLYDELLEADAMILATPVYWFGVPGHVKNFIDRLTALENMIFVEGRSWLEGKVAGVIAVGNDSGDVEVLSEVALTLNFMGMAIPPWGLSCTTEADPISSDSTLVEAANVGRSVALMAKLMRGVKARWYDPKPVDPEGVRRAVVEEAEREFLRVRDTRWQQIGRLLRGPSELG